MRSVRTAVILLIAAIGTGAPALARCVGMRLMIQGETGGNFWTQPGHQYYGWFWLAGRGNNLLNPGTDEPEAGIDSGKRGGALNPGDVTNWLMDTTGDGSALAVRTWDWASAGEDGCADANNNGRADPNEVLAVLLVDGNGGEFALMSVGGNHELGWDYSKISNGTPSVFGIPAAGIPMQPVPLPVLGVPTEAAGGRVNLEVTVPATGQIKTFDEVGGSRNMVQGFHIIQDDTLLAEVGGLGSSTRVRATPGRPLVLRTIFGFPGDAGFYVDGMVNVPNVGEQPEPADEPGRPDDAGQPDDVGRPDDVGAPDDAGAPDDTGAAGGEAGGALIAGSVGAQGAGGEDGEPVDSDEDELLDDEDNCPDVANPDQEDADEDGVGDFCDSCPFDANADQMDTDDDGLGDPCDPCPDDPTNSDVDGDGACDGEDNCVEVANAGQEDRDGDGAGDACDETFDPWVASVDAQKASGPAGTNLEMLLVLQNRSDGARKAKLTLAYRDKEGKETAVPAAESCLPKEPWEVEVPSGERTSRKCTAAIPAGAEKGAGTFVLKVQDAADENVKLESELKVTVR